MLSKPLRTSFIFILLFGLSLFGSNVFAEDEAGKEAPADQESGEAPGDESASTTVDDPLRIGGLNEEQLRQLAIASEVKEHEVVWLEVSYPEQEDVHQVLALEQRPRSPQAQSQGAVLILHDKEQHADWPYLIHPLRMTLPDSGWYTLTVNLPYDDVRNIPKRSLDPKAQDTLVMSDDLRLKLQQASLGKNSEQKDDMEGGTEDADGSEEADTEVSEESSDDSQPEGGSGEQGESVDIDLAEKEKPKLPYRDRALAHVKAAMEHVNKKGYRNIIVIGYRAGADIMMEYIKPLAANIGKQGFALVMIDPKLQLGYQTDLSSALGLNFRAPVLDVVNGADLDSRVDAAEREAGARIASAQLYRQIRLTANESGAFQQTLIRRIRAWVEKYAPGMQAQQFRAQ